MELISIPWLHRSRNNDFEALIFELNEGDMFSSVEVCSLRWKYKCTNFQIFCSSDILLLNFLNARAEDSIHICPGPQCSLAFKVKLDLRTKEKLQKISLLSISMQSLQSSANISMQSFCKSEINHSTQHPLAFCALGKRSTCSKQRRNSRAISEDLNYVQS